MESRMADEGMGSIPHPKRHKSWASQPFVTVFAGPDRTPILIYAFKLAEYSPTILKHAESSNENGNGRSPMVIFVPDVGVDTMDVVVNWMYTGHLDKVEAESEVAMQQKSEEDEEEAEPECTEHNEEHRKSRTPEKTQMDQNGDAPTPTIEDRSASSATRSPETSSLDHRLSNLDYPDILDIYIFADNYNFPTLKQEAMKCCQRLYLATNMLPAVEVVKRAYNVLTKDSNFAQMMAHQYAVEAAKCPLAESVEHNRSKYGSMDGMFGLDFHYFKDNITKWTCDPKNKGKYRYSWCKFHDHASPEERNACRTARENELNEMETRKRPRCWRDLEQLSARVKRHTAEFKKCRVTKNKKMMALECPVDEDLLVVPKNWIQE